MKKNPTNWELFFWLLVLCTGVLVFVTSVTSYAPSWMWPFGLILVGSVARRIWTG